MSESPPSQLVTYPDPRSLELERTCVWRCRANGRRGCILGSASGGEDGGVDGTQDSVAQVRSRSPKVMSQARM